MLLYGILLLYAMEDLSRQKVSNGNILIGMAAGFLFGTGSGREALFRLAGIVVLFFFGMLNLMSMGDLKVWMVITSFTGFFGSAAIIFSGCILLLLYAWLDVPYETRSAMRGLYLTWKAPCAFPLADTGYPFVPFLLAGTAGYRLLSQML